MRTVLALLAPFLLASCAVEEPAPAQIHVAVTGPRDWIPPEEMRLEIDDSAWAITADGGGGVVSVESREAVEVRLFGFPGCWHYAFFDADPGSASVVRFAADGSFLVEDWTGRALDSGPLLTAAEPSGCR